MKKYITILSILFLIALCKAKKVAVPHRKAPTSKLDYAGSIIELGLIAVTCISNSKIMAQNSVNDTLDLPLPISTRDELRNMTYLLEYLSYSNEKLRTEVIEVKDVLNENFILGVPKLQSINEQLLKINMNILKIDKLYYDFLEYLENKDNRFNKEQLIKLAETISAGNLCGLKSFLLEINGLLIKSSNRVNRVNLVTLLVQNMENFLRYTNTQQSKQQYLYSLLKTVCMNEVRGYVLIHFAYEILKKYKKGNYNLHIEQWENEYRNRIRETVNEFSNAMQSLSREYTVGDPEIHQEGLTYVQMRRLFQTFLISEKDLNEDDNCWNYCEDYQKVNNIAPACHHGDAYCKTQRKCAGNVLKCKYILQEDLQVCLSPKNSNRRYEYIIDGNSDIQGIDQQRAIKNCPTSLVAAESHRVWPTVAKCQVCTCICDEVYAGDATDRIISLDYSESDYKDNYVITGTRLVRNKNLLQIQIQQGLLMPNGLINQNTIEWIPLKTPELTATLQYDQLQEINLDDVEAYKKDQVVVGIRFGFIQAPDINNYRILLCIKAISIDFFKGKILNKNPVDIFEDPAKDEIKLSNCDIPTRSAGASNKKSRSGQFLKFQPSGLYADAGQSTIPFIDIQNITTYPPSPLSGVGLYHKSRKGNGGFLALKLITFDFAHYTSNNITLNVDSTDTEY